MFCLLMLGRVVFWLKLGFLQHGAGKGDLSPLILEEGVAKETTVTLNQQTLRCRWHSWKAGACLLEKGDSLHSDCRRLVLGKGD